MIINYEELKEIFNKIQPDTNQSQMTDAFNILKNLFKLNFYNLESSNDNIKELNSILDYDSYNDTEIIDEKSSFLLPQYQTLKNANEKPSNYLYLTSLLEALITPSINKSPNNSVQRLFFKKFGSDQENIQGIKTGIHNFFEAVQTQQKNYKSDYSKILFSEINKRIENATSHTLPSSANHSNTKIHNPHNLE